MKVPQEVVSAAVQAIEETGDNDGWDMLPVLLAISGRLLNDDTPDPRDSGYANGVMLGAVGIQALPVPPEIWIDRDPVEVVQALAEGFLDVTATPAQDLVEALAQPEFTGIAFMSEAWMNGDSNIDLEAADRLALADIPSSVEIRQVDCVDVAGRYTRCQRVRGGKAEVFDAPGFSMAGGVPEALRDMVLGVAKNMRPDDADVYKIAKLIKSREQMRREYREARRGKSEPGE